jgi:hypothetical protein
MDCAFGACDNEMCRLVLEQFQEQKSHSEQLKIENEVMRISLKDHSDTSEAAIKELKRLLEKETHLVNMLNAELAPDASGAFPSCAWCMYHRQQARIVREANAQEFRWVSHFAKLSRNLRLELGEALTREKGKHSQLKCAYDELHARKTDPLHRDGEIVRLRKELADAKQQHLNANNTALMANRVAEELQRELFQAQRRVAELEGAVGEGATRIKALEEVVETCKRSEELRGCAIGDCKDYVCRRRAMDLYRTERELREEIGALQRERAHCLGVISQLRHNSEEWKAVLGGDDQPMAAAEDEERPPKAKTPLVADLTSFDELTTNLRSLFQISPACYHENLDEKGMLWDFVADIEPRERIENLRWILAACHGGVLPANLLENEDLAAAKITRKCFSACIRALGGVSRKVGSRVVWVNVRRTRRPVFAR